jgi:V8-like Glu-specific endopeptidase
MKILFVIFQIFWVSNILAIVGGENTDNFSNLVQISGVRLCTGTAIHPHIILTAAHCTDNGRIPLIITSFKDNKNYNVKKVIPHKTALFHPKQSTLLKGYDIAIIILEKPIPLKKEKFIKLSEKGKFLYKNGKGLEILGIGIDESGWPVYRPKIVKTKVSKIPYWKCGGNKRTAFSSEYVTRDGDSGGPVLTYSNETKKYVQVGVNSSVIIFDYENEYLPEEEHLAYDCKNKSIAMKVSDFYKWIKLESGFSNERSMEEITLIVKRKFSL